MTRDFSKRMAGVIAATMHRAVGSRSGDAGILVYHRICDTAGLVNAPTMNVTPQRFRQQLETLLADGYRFASLFDFFTGFQNAEIPAKTLVVTFDDIFQNVYHNAWPILVELNVPATVFVATAFLDSTSAFPFDGWGIRNAGSVAENCYLPVKTRQCQEMFESGWIEVGAHTHTHQKFKDDLAGFADDLTRCLVRLRSFLDVEAIPFAFPFGRRSLGAVTDEMIDVVRRSGAYCALTTDCCPIGETDSPFSWGRFNVYQWDTAKTIGAKIGGWYSWAPRLQDLLLEGKNSLGKHQVISQRVS